MSRQPIVPVLDRTLPAAEYTSHEAYARAVFTVTPQGARAQASEPSQGARPWRRGRARLRCLVVSLRSNTEEDRRQATRALTQ